MCLKKTTFMLLHKHYKSIERRYCELWDLYLRRGGYEGPPVDELLAGGEVGLVVWLAARRRLDPRGAGRLLQVVTPLVRVGDRRALPKVKECLLLKWFNLNRLDRDEFIKITRKIVIPQQATLDNIKLVPGGFPEITFVWGHCIYWLIIRPAGHEWMWVING